MTENCCESSEQLWNTIDYRSVAASEHHLGATVPDLAASHPYLWQVKITFNLYLTSSYSGLTLKPLCQILPLLIFPYSPYRWKNVINWDGEQYILHKRCALQSCPEKSCDYEAEFKIFTYWKNWFLFKAKY